MAFHYQRRSEIPNFIFNTAQGRVRTYFDNAAGGVAAAQIVAILLKVADTDDIGRDFTNVSALLAGLADEATFTNYARKDIEDAAITVTVDNANNWVKIDITDQTWVTAGGAVNNNLTDVVFAYDATGTGADSTLIPICQHDFIQATDGSNMPLLIATDGLIRAS